MTTDPAASRGSHRGEKSLTETPRTYARAFPPDAKPEGEGKLRHSHRGREGVEGRADAETRDPRNEAHGVVRGLLVAIEASSWWLYLFLSVFLWRGGSETHVTRAPGFLTPSQVVLSCSPV